MDPWSRWICPTDRKLALRSKMHKGFTSMQIQAEHGGENCTGSCCALTTEEARSIARVLRDNEALLAVERKRVCHYADKLEALRSAACGDGCSRCHLCGEKASGIVCSPFAARLHCRLCGLVTCSKCGTKSHPKPDTAASVGKVETAGAKEWGCSLFRREQPKNWECKICHREIQLWKKSGAWFYKRLPPHNIGGCEVATDAGCDEEGLDSAMPDFASDCDCGEGNGISAAKYGATAIPERHTEASHTKPAEATAAAGSSAPSPAADFHDRGLGALHFVLQYIPGKAALYIRIIKGESLRAHDTNGLSDPYVKMHLLPDTGKRTKLRTRTCQRTLNPVWDEEFCYSGVTKSEMATKMLRLSVLDEDTIGFDWMGEILYPLGHLLQHNRKEYSEVFLQPKNFELDKSLKLQEDDRGKIMIGLCYAPAKNELTVSVIQCVNLIAMDPNGYSDPFVKLHLKPDDGTPKKCKTEVKRRTLNPDFDEEFCFLVTPQELPHKTLEITVWDKDFGSKNDFMGALALGNQCSGERWSHWEVLLRQPYQRHDRWHALCPELFLAD